MKPLKQRLAALEGVVRTGWDAVHEVIQHVGQTQAEAVSEYGKPIGPRDLLVIRKIVAAGKVEQ